MTAQSFKHLVNQALSILYKSELKIQKVHEKDMSLTAAHNIQAFSPK